MWPPAGRIRAECPSSSFMIRNQRHPQRHPRRNRLFRRYGETRQEGPSGRNCGGRTKLVHRCGQFLYRSGGADLLSHTSAHGGLDARLGASLVPRHRCHRSERSSPPRGRELEPRNRVLRLDSGPVVARLDAGERLMGPAKKKTSCTWSRRLPIGYPATQTDVIAFNKPGDVERGFRPRRSRHQPLGADSSPRTMRSGEREREAEAGW
jgi:hypothetical protein